MTLPQVLFKHSAWIFGGFTILAVLAFWRNYLSDPLGPHPTVIHLHAVVMFVWLAMLIAQALLIRTKQYSAHHAVGRWSFGVVSLILISGVLVAHESISGMPADSARRAANSALMYHSLIAFAVIYGLGMWHRNDPITHARYMVGTLFPMVTPITDRLIFHHAPFILPVLPTLEGRPQAYIAGFVLVDLLLIGLFLIDLKAKKRSLVFGLILTIVLIYHLSVVLWPHFPMLGG